MLETALAKELSVAEEVDRLVGCDSSYCPMYYDLRPIARRAQWRGGVVRANPVLPRTVFITASFPDLAAVVAIQGVESIVRNPWGVPEVIPGWEMGLFQQEVEKRRLWCLKMAAKGTAKTKAPKFGSFAALKEWFDSNNRGEILGDDGEILISSQAA